jgi:transcriptional regulator with XRE-family HTH domain
MGGQDLTDILGRNIRQLRTDRNLSQADLAEKAGISITFLSNIERGNKWPYPDTLLSLAKALNIEVYELFKPSEASDSRTVDINKCLDDVLVALRQSVDKTITHSIEKIRKSYL